GGGGGAALGVAGRRLSPGRRRLAGLRPPHGQLPPHAVGDRVGQPLVAGRRVVGAVLRQDLLRPRVLHHPVQVVDRDPGRLHDGVGRGVVAADVGPRAGGGGGPGCVAGGAGGGGGGGA